jgi:hypothetical protein
MERQNRTSRWSDPKRYVKAASRIDRAPNQFQVFLRVMPQLRGAGE